MKKLALSLAFVLLGVAASAQEGFDVKVQVGGQATLSDSGTAVTPSAFIDAEGPLVFGSSQHGRLYAHVGITSLPGETLDLTSIETFRAAEVSLGGYATLGSLKVGEQEIVTGLAAEWGFSSRIPGNDQPLVRLIRHYGIGLHLAEKKSGSFLTLLYGRDEAGGARGWGQWIVYGALPITGTKGMVTLTGDATLSVGKASDALAPFQRDVLRLGLTVDLASVAKALSK